MLDTRRAPGPGAANRVAARPPGRIPLLFLIAETGGGHRAAATAVAEALDHGYPGRYAPVLFDPLAGPDAPRLLRWITAGYGPLIRLAPWLWGAIYYATDSRPAAWLLHRGLLALVGRPVASALTAIRPAAVVSFHPLTGRTVARALCGRQPGERTVPLVTVVTDLGTPHATCGLARPAWR
jgi:1,2-diacylglycerol 3-beta-galactosyltransferase